MNDLIKEITTAAREAFPGRCSFSLHCEFGMSGNLMHFTVSAGDKHIYSETALGLIDKLQKIKQQPI